MKKFKDLRKEIAKEDEILGYATIHSSRESHASVDKLVAQDPDEILGVAGLRGINKLDKSLDESWTLGHTTKLTDFNRRGISAVPSSAAKMSKSGIHPARKEFEDNQKSVAHHTKDLEKLPKNPDEQKAHNAQEYHLNEYTHSSTSLNKHLIESHKKGKEPTRYTANIKHIDDAVTHKKNALKKGIVTYSGVGNKFAESISKAKIGSRVHFPAYTSTTIDHEISGNFGKAITHGKSGVTHPDGKLYGRGSRVEHTLVFHLPKGFHKGKYIEHVSLHKGEHEYLMGRGQKFKIKDRHYDPHNSTVYHHMEPS